MVKAAGHQLARDDIPEGPEGGFTLIELLVVLLIMGVLLAIAIPTFLSVSNASNDTAAQSDLQTALTGVKAYYTENQQTYAGAYAGFSAIDTGVVEVTSTASSTSPHIVSFDVVSGSEIVLTALGPGAQDCWGIVDLTATGSTVLGYSGPGALYFEQPASGGSCAASGFTGSTVPAGVKTSTTGFGNI